MTQAKQTGTPYKVYRLEYEFIDADEDVCLDDLLLDRRVSTEEGLQWSHFHAAMNGYKGVRITCLELTELELDTKESSANFLDTEVSMVDVAGKAFFPSIVDSGGE